MTGFHKRSHDRHTLSLYMEVVEDRRNNQPLIKCRTNNIGMGGMMVHNKDISMPRGSNVSVVLKATCRSGLKVFPAQARIVWKTSEAVGLQFSSFNETEQKKFKRFLFESKVAAHSGERRRWRRTPNVSSAVVEIHHGKEIAER